MYSEEEIQAEYDRTYAMYHKPKVKPKKHPEKLIRDKIVKYLEGIGALVINTPAGLMTVNGRTFSIGEQGRADLHCCYKGLWISVETKADGKHATPAQRKYADRVRAAGGIWIEASSVEDVRRGVEGL